MVDNTSFAEFLCFLRTHPQQRKQLLAALVETDTHQQADASDGHYEPLRTVAERYGMPLSVFRALLKKEEVNCRMQAGGLTVHAAQARRMVERRYAQGQITDGDAAALIGCNYRYISQGRERNYWRGGDGWVLKQDVVDHVLLHSRAAVRAGFVERLEAFDAAKRRQVVPVIPLQAAQEPMGEQLEMALNG